MNLMLEAELHLHILLPLIKQGWGNTVQESWAAGQL